MFRVSRHFARPEARRLIGVGLIVAICVALIPLPLASVTSRQKDRSEAYPCRDRPCGCQSAQQCWKKCCCFTNKQKVAWARANQVRIPEFVVVAAAREIEIATQPRRGGRSSHSSCCGGQGAPANVCRAGDALCSSHAPKTNRASAPRGGTSKIVIGVFAEACRGEHGSISSFPPAVPVPIAFPPGLSTAADHHSFPSSDSAIGRSDPPALRPPRQAETALV